MFVAGEKWLLTVQNPLSARPGLLYAIAVIRYLTPYYGHNPEFHRVFPCTAARSNFSKDLPETIQDFILANAFRITIAIAHNLTGRIYHYSR